MKADREQSRAVERLDTNDCAKDGTEAAVTTDTKNTSGTDLPTGNPASEADRLISDALWAIAKVMGTHFRWVGDEGGTGKEVVLRKGGIAIGPTRVHG